MHTEVSTNVRLIILRPMLPTQKAKRDYPYHSETTGYWEEHVWENVLSFNKTFGKHNVNAMAGTSMTARKYTWNSVGVEGKTTVYKVEDGKLVTSEIPGGFLDPSFSTVGAGAGGTLMVAEQNGNITAPLSSAD